MKTLNSESKEEKSPSISKPLKIGIVGASGKIGTEVLKTIWGNSEKFPNMGAIIALNTLPRVNFGMFLDFSVAYSEKMHIEAKQTNTKTVLTDSPAELKDADCIFITAGLWPNETVRNEWIKKDNTGRLVQSLVNFPLIKKICGDIKKYAPNAIVFVITNQVDMMTELARKELPKHKVLGVGGYIDSMRFKFVLANLLHQIEYINTNNPARIAAHMIGFHNNTMLLLKDSLRVDGKIPDWNNKEFSSVVDKAMEITRSFGKTISDLQNHPKRPGIDSGSSIVPAKAITDVIQAMCTGSSLVASFNTLVDENIALKYGIKANTALSIPIVIRGMNIEPLMGFKVSDLEKEKLLSAQEKIKQDMTALLELQANQPSLIEAEKNNISIAVNSQRVPMLPLP